MRWKWTRAATLIGAIGFAASGGLGCAEEREPINRVQADALSKSFFVGEDLHDPLDNPSFYAQGTLIDVGYGAAQDGLFTSTYAQPMSIVRWEITEDLLIGRLAYERIDDSDGKGAGAHTLDGQIAYAYKIIKHFDIRRAYNPTTGEESNVIEENSSDRPWYEREYMRVDWSQNMNTDAYDYDTLSLLGIYGGINYEPLSYYVNDPNHEDAPHFSPNDGYFDVTNKALAAPAEIDLSHLGWGIDSFPACFLENDLFGGSYPAGNCNPVELTIRQAFRRVENTDYEPVDWDGYRFQAYGAFYVERYGYARNYGMTDTKWRRFIARYNIWERSHYYDDPETMEGAVECFTPDTTPYGGDPKRDENNDGTHDECEAVTGKADAAGSKCDTFSQKCTLPYRERKVVPIVWYYTKGSNNEYYDGTDWATHEWDVAMRLAVQTGKYAECARTSANPADCANQYPVPTGQMTQMRDLVDAAREVDLCRREQIGEITPDEGELFDEAAAGDCEGEAISLLEARGYSQGTAEFAGILETAVHPEMVVLCHSPVEAGDHPLCGTDARTGEVIGSRLPSDISAAECEEEWSTGGDMTVISQCDRAFSARIGDLRYHQVNVLKNPQTPQPWGIYTDAESPLTGEAISASINVWSDVTDRWSQSYIDIARYIAGELSTDQVTDGEYIKDWAQASFAASGAGALPPMTREQVDSRVVDFARQLNHNVALEPPTLEEQGKPLVLDATLTAVDTPIPEMVQQARDTARMLRSDIRADLGAPSAFAATYRARREMAKNTELEAELTTPMMMEYAGAVGLPLDGAIEYASPLRQANPTFAREVQQMKEIALAERGACILQEAPSPTAMAGLTTALQQKFGNFNANSSPQEQFDRSERMRKYLAQRAHFAVIVHEMGHSIGERHNFVSSSSAFNYRPQYWQLRTKNGSIGDDKDTQEILDPEICKTLASGEDAENCIGPRYYDSITPNERDNLIWMFMHSSVMDYAGEATQDLLGLGAYDFAAARMFYADVVSVFEDDSFEASSKRSLGILNNIMDNFGGILGYGYGLGSGDGQGIDGVCADDQNCDFHYSQLNRHYDLIQDCQPVDDPAAWRPSDWNAERDGEWHPTLDGLLVKADANEGYSRCKQQGVDYVQWDALRFPDQGEGELSSAFYRGGPAIERGTNRMRYPYAFATDRWADLGNTSVYRHDNGADIYELFDFFITEQEVRHIWDNYRRDRQGFSVRSASGRILGRYNAKMRDSAKGLGLFANIYRTGLAQIDFDFDPTWNAIATGFLKDNILASGLAFDHFARQMARPEIGPHGFPTDGALGFIQEPILRSTETDIFGLIDETVLVPNGASGFYENVGIGGKLVENQLAENMGEYDSEFTVNAGSYYDKLWTTMLMTESVDNFISDSLDDFTDKRYRAVSFADLFPDGYRRWLANNLTNDDVIKAPRLTADPSNCDIISGACTPNMDEDKFPSDAIGWTTWWTSSPELCFPANGTTVCSSYGAEGAYNPQAPAATVAVDPQIGFEQQKFLIAWTLMYLPENQKQNWLNMMGIWEVGVDNDPGFTNRIELHAPTGQVFVARTYGTEEICFETCKTVQRGVGARILEYANELMFAAYSTTEVVGDTATWYMPNFDPGTGQVIVFSEPDAFRFENYLSVPVFMRMALRDLHMAPPSMTGIYN